MARGQYGVGAADLLDELQRGPILPEAREQHPAVAVRTSDLSAMLPGGESEV
jgi:hypothetical protein